MGESESKIDVVQIDGLVVMKLIKHCHEVDLSAPGGIAQGALLGLVTDTRLEITHAFPFPSSSTGAAAGADDSVDDEDFQLDVMRKLRMVNVDHLHVGWYQSAHFGAFLSPQLLESHFAYQTSIEESVCLIFDTAKTTKGFLSLKAYRLTQPAIELYKANDFTPEKIKNLKVSYDSLFREVPIVIKNSHLMNTVDDMNQESIKFNKYQTMAIKQFQDKTRYLQKRQLDNNARTARGEDPLPDEDINKIFKPIAPPSRLNSLILSGQILSSAEQVQQFCSESMAKWFVTGALQEAKTKSSST